VITGRSRSGVDRAHAIYKLTTRSVAGYDRIWIRFLQRAYRKEGNRGQSPGYTGTGRHLLAHGDVSKYPGDEGTEWHQADTFGHASGAPQIVWPTAQKVW